MTDMPELKPSVIYREGELTEQDYDDAIEALRLAKSQMTPDGDNCHVCGDGHQAMHCHLNPLYMVRQLIKRQISTWRCFHCGAEFTDEAKAREHFGENESVSAACTRPTPPADINEDFPDTICIGIAKTDKGVERFWIPDRPGDFHRYARIKKGAPVTDALPKEGDAIAAYKPGSWFQARTVDEMSAFYMSRLPAIREAAREHGYAIGLHGSTRRDFDLMAMQWRENASDKDTLAIAIQHAACGLSYEKIPPDHWEDKGAGRFAVSLPICWTEWHDMVSAGHIDLSVIALHAPAPVTDAQREALEEFPEGRNHGDLCRYLDKHEGTIRAALSAPVAQVDVEHQRHNDFVTDIIAECPEDVFQKVLDRHYTKDEQDKDCQRVKSIIDGCMARHLTPKTQSEE